MIILMTRCKGVELQREYGAVLCGRQARPAGGWGRAAAGLSAETCARTLRLRLRARAAVAPRNKVLCSVLKVSIITSVTVTVYRIYRIVFSGRVKNDVMVVNKRVKIFKINIPSIRVLYQYPSVARTLTTLHIIKKWHPLLSSYTYSSQEEHVKKDAYHVWNKILICMERL